MLEFLKKSSAADRLVEEQLYEQVVKELSNGQRRDGLWAKAFADSEGSEEYAKSLYIKYRVQSLIDEATIEKVFSDNHQERLISDVERSLQSLGCKVKRRNDVWYLTDSFGGTATVSTFEDLKVSEEFFRRVYNALSFLRSKGYRIEQIKNGWIVKKFWEASKKFECLDSLERFVSSVQD